MSSKATITVLGTPDEIRRSWESQEHRPAYAAEVAERVSFRPAPGDRGTEIHVDLERTQSDGKVGAVVGKVTGAVPRAKVMDDLRHFKQLVETGEVPRSDGSPEGERLERKFKQRPAQPLEDHELEKAGV
jgi:uncharacterized membrane protein